MLEPTQVLQVQGSPLLARELREPEQMQELPLLLELEKSQQLRSSPQEQARWLCASCR